MVNNENKWAGIDIALLHILAQACEHDEAIIVGNRAGLSKLLDAIVSAMNGTPAAADVFCDDGEGYKALVVCRDDLEDVPFGYADPHSNHQRFYPQWLHDALRISERGA